MKRYIIIILILSLLFGLSGCKVKAEMQYIIKAGASRDEVVATFGDAVERSEDGNSETFIVDGEKVVVYYQTSSNGELVVKSVRAITP